MGCRVKLLFTSLFAILPVAVSSAAVFGKPGTGLYLLTNDNSLSSVCESLPNAFSPPVALTGLATGDNLVAIDVRPQNQRLYGLAINTGFNTLQLYHIAPETGTVVAVGGVQSLSDGVNPITVSASRYGIDFSPVADRLRVVNSNGLNFRINPNTGGCIDGSPGLPGVNPDGSLNTGTTSADGIAYTNNDPLTASTTNYALDSTTNALYLLNPANGGTMISVAAVTLNGNPVDFSATRGFDVAPAASGSGYAALTISGITSLYSVNLTNGAATFIGTPSGFSVASLAVRTQIPIANALVSSGSNFLIFRTDNPGTTVTVPAGSLNAGETLAGIDFRPSTGQLMGLGVNPTTDTATLYLIEAKGGTVTAVGTPGGISFTSDGVTPVDLPPVATGYGFDFNPSVDRIRVVAGSGLSFRINPVLGTPVDGGASPGTNPDGDINGGSTVATAAAYTNSYASVGGPTTLYTLDSSSNSLWIQNPPNNGTQTLQKVVKVNGATLDFTAANGFDITADGATTATSNVASPGYGWAALTVSGTARLYRINLLSGEATLKGQIGTGTSLAGLTLACEPGQGFAPLSWTSVIGTNYTVQTSEDLVNWQPYPAPANAGQTTVTLPVPVYQGESRRYWRAVSP
jgi:hypothetical protein